MKEISKILIAYDGSACADAALKDLRRAGLPAALEAVVMAVVDVILPPPEDEVPEDTLFPPHLPDFVRHAQARAEKAVKEAQDLAEQAAARVRADFPNWKVTAEAHGDAPAWAVIKRADSFGADLVVVGTHGHSVVGGRLILGSVSQRVLHEAHCSVRVARCSDERRVGPVRLVVGYNSQPGAVAVLEAVASRSWPDGSEACIVNAGVIMTPAPSGDPMLKLRAAGLSTSSISKEGNPAQLLLQEAKRSDADSIFVGTRDIHGIKHFLQGSVSAEVAARAACSVEVVRPGRGSA